MVAGVGVAGGVVGDAVEGDSVAADSVGGVVAVPSVVGVEVGDTGLEVELADDEVGVEVVDAEVLDADVLGGAIGAACPVELGPQPLNATAAMASPATALSRVLTVVPLSVPEVLDTRPVERSVISKDVVPGDTVVRSDQL